MRCTVLVENTTTRSDLTAQHGLSLFIEMNQGAILVDAGQDTVFSENAAVLGKNIRDVRFAVCSHAHYDHAGGFSTFCQINKTAKIYTYWKAGMYCYSSAHAAPGESPYFIGWNPDADCLKRIQTVNNSKPFLVADGIYLVPVIEHSFHMPYTDKHLFIEENGLLQKDLFSHECVLALETSDKGFALFNSCSHSGVINSIESVRHFFPATPIRSYTGGFHFPWNAGEKMADDDHTALLELISYAEKDHIRLYSGHCTGAEPLALLEQLYGSFFQHLSTGFSYTL